MLFPYTVRNRLLCLRIFSPQFTAVMFPRHFEMTKIVRRSESPKKKYSVATKNVTLLRRNRRVVLRKFKLQSYCGPWRTPLPLFHPGASPPPDTRPRERFPGRPSFNFIVRTSSDGYISEPAVFPRPGTTADNDRERREKTTKTARFPAVIGRARGRF